MGVVDCSISNDVILAVSLKICSETNGIGRCIGVQSASFSTGRRAVDKMAEPSASESSPETDRDFDPSAEMLVNDFDDERTLEEEEAMESGEDVQNELDELQKEGDMPLEDLLAIYGGYTDGNQADTMQSSSSEEILSNQDLTLDKDEIARDLLPDEEKCTSVHELLETMDASNVSNSRLLRSSVPHHQSESESETEDEDYVPDDDDWKKTIQVGSDYQAAIPDGLCKYDGAPAYENEDKLLWDPYPLEDPEVDSYLRFVANITNNNCSTQPNSGVAAIPSGAHVRDDEQALYLLLQCGHNMEEAQRRRRMQSVAPTDTMSLWSEEECRCFENGLRTYGKDFHLIQQNRVRTRSVGELVQFYYLWKKTERHDVFANKARLEKKKYSLHPGTTDYMDRFLDEHENPPSTHRDRSSSPNIHSLISGDHKRQQHLHHHHHHPYHQQHRQADHFDTTGAFPLPAEFNQHETGDSINNCHHSSSLRKHSSDLTNTKHHVLAPTLEDLAKNLSQGLEHDGIVDTSNNEFNSELSHRNNYHQSHRNNQINSLKSIDMSIASVNNSISSDLIQASAASSFAQ